MPMPPSVTKIKTKNGKCELEFVSSVDRVNYTMEQLIRKANQEVGKYIAKQCNATARNTLRVYKKGTRVGTMIKKAAFQYWARKAENDLQVGIKHDTWYGVNQEIGDKGMPKLGILYSTVKDNISNIRDIQGKYISAIEDEQKATQFVEEAEAEGEEVKD